MKKLEKITKNIKDDKQLMKRINNQSFFSVEDFISTAERYIKAIKQGRVICSIGKVSASGMSRTIKFLECSKGKTRYNYLNFWTFFKVLGYEEVKNDNYFRVHGCGMDMIFHTNYTNIHNLYSLGFINKKQCAELAQMTPPVI